MDPDAALARIRALCIQILDDDNDRDLDEHVGELVGRLSGLDEWLSKGGFPPRAWTLSARGRSS